MFHPVGLFKNLECPNRNECSLQNCIFNHDLTAHEKGSADQNLYDPFTAGEHETPPSKRRRIDAEGLTVEISRSVNNLSNSLSINQRPLPVSSATPETSLTRPPNKALASAARHTNKLLKETRPISAQRPVSPPPKRVATSTHNDKIEKLVPRPVPRAPAVLKVRMSLIEMLYKYMTVLNSQVGEQDEDLKHYLLTDQQIINWTLDDEEQAAAKLSSDIYRNAMSQKVVQLKRMKVADWTKLVFDRISPSKPSESKNNQVPSGLSAEEEVQVLKYLRTNLTGLDNHGYVTKPPSAADIQRAKETVKASAGYELCDRCGVRFQVFPGRDEQGNLTTKGECHYHWAKINRGTFQKTDHITGQVLSSYPCCGQMTGSEGCTQAPTHVFKVTDAKRMAALMQFEPTPTRDDGRKCGPVAFDCEMAYTTYGMEVVRVTAVSWPRNETLLDILVRPFGEILDLNTRFSGIAAEQYTSAKSYQANTDHDDDASEEGEVDSEALRKVESPIIARQLMFDLLTPETPLIGHAVDNDLNTCRIIHPFVIDTVLLFPHPRGLPIRYGLKMLASKYLDRSIQTGGDAGHDSKEDSVATGDLVRIKVAEKWQMMRLQGWKFHDGVLTAPGR